MYNMLVTGGLGFIGSNFIHHRLEEHSEEGSGDRIINLDKETYAADRENLSDFEDDERLLNLKIDICDHREVVRILRENDIRTVVHFAAESHVDNSINGPSVFIKNNVTGTQSLLEAARKVWGDDYEGRRFVNISTDEVYGSLKDEGYFNEDNPLKPNSPYSASKASADLIARSYFKTYRFPVITTRCSNNYGPRQHREKLIPLMIRNILSDKNLPVYGRGENVRDWIYVMDHCRAVSSVIQSGKIGDVYNIGASCERRNIDLVKKLIETAGKSEDLITFVKDRPGHDYRYAIDSSKIRNETGWRPEVSFEQGLKKTFNWYKESLKG